MTATTVQAKEIKPATGDILLTTNRQGTTWVYEIGDIHERTYRGKTYRHVKPGTCIAESVVFRGKRYIFDRLAKLSKPAKDCTPRKLTDRKTARYVLGKHLPQLNGRRLWVASANGYEYLLRVTTDAQPKQARKIDVVPRDKMEYVPGAILYSSWGYDQTNIDWLEIVERRGCWVFVQEIGSKNVQRDGDPWMTGHSLPNPDVRKGKIMKRRVRVRDGKETGIRIDDVRNAWLWDDKVFALNDRREWEDATIESLSPYLGRPGYYIYWDAQMGKPLRHESKGGWKPETMLVARDV